MSTSYVISPRAVARKVGEETVILDLEKGTYYGLDPIGARIWELMNEGKTLQDICAVMLDEYEVSLTALERDVLDLVQALAENGLLQFSSSGPE